MRNNIGKIDVVITMAGLGSRFRKAGYRIPKYMIEAKGKTLFEWSMMSLEGYREKADRYLFIAMRDEACDVERFLTEKCGELGYQNCRVVLLDSLTGGQAETAMAAEEYWNPEHGLLIYNIDTYVEAGEMNSGQLKGDGFIPCFEGEGDHWSFVRLDDSGKAAEIREKERISAYCTLGAYYFKSCRLYKELYREFYGKGGRLVKGEKYVAPLYECLLARNGEIYISNIAPEKVHVLGTPEELQVFLDE